jgi:DNA invertase Pin-like site-specific DNA recombinase
MENRYAILLVRVSTEQQDYDAQIIDLKDFAIKKGFNQFKIIETKESGLINIDQRIGTNEMFEFIKENPQYQTVIATEISRLARRQSTLHPIKDWLVKNKIQLYLKDSDFRLLNKQNKITVEGEMMFSLFGIFAETEITQKKLRFSREKRKLMAMGLSISGVALFGYKREQTETKQNRLVHHEENADKVRKIFNWYLNGINGDKEVSISKINIQCIKDNFPKYTHSKRNINKLLKEGAYTGKKITKNKWKNPMYRFDKTVEPYLYSSNEIFYGEPIIDRETFDAVQKKLKEKNTTVDKSVKHITLLSKLIICPVCNKYFQGDYRNSIGVIKHSYRCGSRSTPFKCSNKQSFSMAMLDTTIWCVIKSDLELLARQIVENDPKEDNIKLNDELINLDNKEAEIKEKIRKENFRFNVFIENPDSAEPDYLEKFQVKMKSYDQSINQIKNEKAKIRNLLTIKNEELNDLDLVINSNLENIESSKELLKRYINIFIENINIHLHNTRYTILELKFNIYGEDKLVKHNGKSAEYIETPYTKNTFVILDKRQTLKIRSYKTNVNLKVIDSETINVMKSEIPINRIFQNSTVSEYQKGVLKEFVEFKFDKLSIYKNKA